MTTKLEIAVASDIVTGCRGCDSIAPKDGVTQTDIFDLIRFVHDDCVLNHGTPSTRGIRVHAGQLLKITPTSSADKEGNKFMLIPRSTHVLSTSNYYNIDSWVPAISEPGAIDFRSSGYATTSKLNRQFCSYIRFRNRLFKKLRKSIRKLRATSMHYRKSHEGFESLATEWLRFGSLLKLCYEVREFETNHIDEFKSYQHYEDTSETAHSRLVGVHPNPGPPKVVLKKAKNRDIEEATKGLLDEVAKLKGELDARKGRDAELENKEEMHRAIGVENTNKLETNENRLKRDRYARDQYDYHFEQANDVIEDEDEGTEYTFVEPYHGSTLVYFKRLEAHWIEDLCLSVPWSLVLGHIFKRPLSWRFNSMAVIAAGMLTFGYKCVKIARPAQIGIKYIVTKTAQSMEFDDDHRGLDTAQDFGETVVWHENCFLVRYDIKKEVIRTNRFITGRIDEEEPISAAYYLSELNRRIKKISFLPDEVWADPRLVNAVKRKETRLVWTLPEAQKRALINVPRFHNINIEQTYSYEADCARVVACALRAAAEDQLMSIDPFHKGVSLRYTRIRSYSEVLVLGYVVPTDALKDLLNVALGETRDGFVKAELVQETNSFRRYDFYILGVKCKGKPVVFMKAKFSKEFETCNERYMLRRLPAYVPHYVPPIPDVSNWSNKRQGLLKRIARVGTKRKIEDLDQTQVRADKKNKISEDTRTFLDPRDFRSYVRSLLYHNYKPLEPGDHIDFFTWLWYYAHNYTLARKKELMDVYLRYCEFFNTKSDGVSGSGRRNDRQVHYFLKVEHYPEYKYARFINAVCDYIKTRLGAATHMMEEQIYANLNELPIKFIKHVPVRDRPQFIKDLLGKIASKIAGSDYSSFESSFPPDRKSVV